MSTDPDVYVISKRDYQDFLTWVFYWARITDSLVFWWQGEYGLQPVLMPAGRYTEDA